MPCTSRGLSFDELCVLLWQVVESMRQGASPKQAAEAAIQRIVKHYPLYVGALFAVDKAGNHAGACHGWTFQYAFQDSTLKAPQIVTVQPVEVKTKQANTKDNAQS